MSSAGPGQSDPQDVRGYLCVDGFMRTLVDARALQSAFELGLVDRLREDGPVRIAGLEGAIGTDSEGLRVLLALLASNRVVEVRDDAVRLSRPFETALRYRDLLVTKLEFARVVAGDFADGFTALIHDPALFMREARLFDLFAYDRCFESTPENLEATRRWVRITTALTRYEAAACLEEHDFGRYRRMLDIGGNSGEFALRVCKRHPGIEATVVDLPVVCDVGRAHVGDEPEADRIRFLAGDARMTPLPRGFDLVSFKSMLHDWPEEQAREFIARASESLSPGGTLLIFERGPIEPDRSPIPYSLIPMLLFFRSFREPTVYARQLESVGFRRVEVREIELESTFFLITATKAGDRPSAD